MINDNNEPLLLVVVAEDVQEGGAASASAAGDWRPPRPPLCVVSRCVLWCLFLCTFYRRGMMGANERREAELSSVLRKLLMMRTQPPAGRLPATRFYQSRKSLAFFAGAAGLSSSLWGASY